MKNTPVAQRLLDRLPIELTEENRRELIDLMYFGRRDYHPDAELGGRLETLARMALGRD